jgi:hypothetical protein
MKAMTLGLAVAVALGVILMAGSPAVGATNNVKITLTAKQAKAIAPSAATAISRCPVLASGKPVTVTLNAATIKQYVPALANVKLPAGKTLTVTIKP